VDASVFERHGQTILSGVVLALMLWVGSTVLDIKDKVTKIEVYQINSNSHDLVLDKEIVDLSNRVRAIELEHARSNAANGKK